MRGKGDNMADSIQRRWHMKTTNILFAAITVAVLSMFSLDPFNVKILRNAPESYEEVVVIPITSGASGPESLAFDPDGEGPYTGVSDGRILKWQHGGWIEYAVDSPPRLLEECKGSQDPQKENLCGRPLGLQFNKKTRDLYIADAYFGLLMVSPGDKFAKPIATEAEGQPFRFPNSLDIDQDGGIVYFTDSSMRFQRRDYMSAIISRDRTGRLMKYDLHKKEVQVLLSGLYFPNGVLLSQDGSFLLIAETTTCRILKYWLRPPKMGSVEVLVHLPGFPDNIKRSPRGGFWVAMQSRRGKVLGWFLCLPHWFGEVVIRLPFGLDRIPSLVSRWTAKSLAMRITEEGEILETVEGFGSKMVSLISEVEERNGTLWIGSVVNPHVGALKPSSPISTLFLH